jgi:C1A family cysteine protease
LRRHRSIVLCGLLLALAAAAAAGAAWPQAPVLGPDTLSVAHRAAMQAELKALHAALQREGQRWQAGETGMLRLGESERRLRLSERPWPEPPRHPATPPRTNGAAGLPARLDWRSAGGDFVSGVRDQGACAVGWAFASTAALESAFLRAAGGGRLPDFDLAEQQLLSCLDDYGLGQGCAGGWPEDALWLAESEGLLAESRLPYAATTRLACPEAGDRRFRFAAASLVCAAADPLAIKRALREQGPLVTTMAVHAGFFAYAGGVYRAQGPLVGYHAALIIGYDDAQGCFIAKNSWGESWGEGGFFHIAYEAGCGFGDWTRAVAFVPAGLGPLAAMEASAQRLRCGQAVQFKDRSLSPASSLSSWEWDFDGDGSVDATGPGPHSHLFRRPGHYQPRLRVRDAAGREDAFLLAGGIEVAFAGPLWRVDAAAESRGDEGNGSAERPFAAIQLALNAAASGDTVLLAPGRYSGSMNTELFAGGKSLVIKAAGGPGTAILDGGSKRRHFRLSSSGTADARLQLQGLNLWNGLDANRGGAILSEGVALVLEDCELAGCTALAERGGGGALWTDASLRLTRCVLRENRSGGSGGAIHVAGSTVELDGCVLAGNAAAGEGGAISQVGGMLAVAHSRFLDNRAGLRGGALALMGVSAGLDALRFSGNQVENGPGALRGGGALAWEAPGADLLITNCLFTDNEAPVGGALRVDGGRFSASQITCWGNRATERGGALALLAPAGSGPELGNSIFWGNLAPAAAEILAMGSLAPRACLVAGGLGGQPVLSEDPRFVDAAGGDFRLAESSPCLGAGDPAGAPALDLAGETRPRPAGSAPDLGAFESALTRANTAAAQAPVGLIFAGAYPNPFNPQTTFTFSLPAAGEVTLEIFQSSGRQVATVLDEEALRAGGHRVTWVARDEAGVPLASGIYLARLSVLGVDGSEERAMQKIILVK